MNKLNKNKILITGGAGFIGSHLVEDLLSEGCKVRVLDNFSTGKTGNLPLENNDLEVIEADISENDIVAKAVKGVDAVVHLAAVASVQASVDDPTGTHRSNFQGTLNLLESCRMEGVKRFLYASSAAVYGNTKISPVTENTILSPLTPYACDKLSGEYYLDFYRRQHGLEPGIFRFFNVFGPRQDPSSPYSGVISIFVDKTREGKGITVFGDGEQTRDFIYVKDLVMILIQALKVEHLEVGAFNVGTGTQTTINSIIKILAEIQEINVSVTYEEPRLGDIKNSLADITRLQEKFNFIPKITLKEGLAILICTDD